jgi:hypothetical protein
MAAPLVRQAYACVLIHLLPFARDFFRAFCKKKKQLFVASQFMINQFIEARWQKGGF